MTPRERSDLGRKRFPQVDWADDQGRQALTELYRFAEDEALNAIDWYLREKKRKSRWSRALRSAAILSAALGALVPLVDAATNEVIDARWGYVMFAIAAAVIAWDRFFGFSSGWMRYMQAAFALQRTLQDFQDDWAAIAAADATVIVRLARLKRLRCEVITVVEDETREWIAEFETSLTGLETKLNRTEH